MAAKYKTDADRWDPEPRWLAWVVVLALGGIYTALPSHLIVGPRYTFLIIIIGLLIPTIFAHFKRHQNVNKILGFVTLGVVTLGEIASVVLLIDRLPERLEAPA